MRCNSKSAHRLCIVGVQAILIASLCAQETISDAARESLPTSSSPMHRRIKIPDAELALSNASHIEALHLMDRTLAIKHASGLVLPEDFEIKYAQTAWAAGQYGLCMIGSPNTYRPRLRGHRVFTEKHWNCSPKLSKYLQSGRSHVARSTVRSPKGIPSRWTNAEYAQTLADLDARPGPEILFKLGQIVSMNLLVVETVAQHNGFPNRLLRASDDAWKRPLRKPATVSGSSRRASF